MVENPDVVMERTADIVSAYVANNVMPAGDLPTLIHSVHQALKNTETGVIAASAAAPTPAVPVKKSVHRDFIICLEDGLKFKSLKRHLSAKYDMTPQEYRAKWGLPSDYPMVAPGYSEQRSELAKKIGLGQKASGRKRPARKK